MIVFKNKKILLFIIFTFIFGLIFGILLHKYNIHKRILIYFNFQINENYKVEINKINKESKKINTEYNLQNMFIDKSRTVETMSYPLKISTFDLKNLGASETGRISICSNTKGIIINLGNNNFVFFDAERNFKFKIPEIKNKINEIVDYEILDLYCDSNKSDDNIVFYQFSSFYTIQEYDFQNDDKNLKDKKNKIYESTFSKVTLSLSKKKVISTESLFSFNHKNQNSAGRIDKLNEDQFILSWSDPTDYESTSEKKEFLAQNVNFLEGKIISLNLKNKEYDFLSIGHRNPQGVFVDENDNIFSTEHGPKGGDEINLILKDKNYGWPITSDGVGYASYKKFYGELGDHSDNFELPIFSWNPGIGISNLIKINSKKFYRWKDDLLVASLKNKTIYRVKLKFSPIAVRYVESIWIGKRLRDLTHFNEKIYIVTDDKQLVELDTNEDLLDRSFVDSRLFYCLSCHHFEKTNSSHTAPSFVGILGRKSGSDEGYDYSNALKNLNIEWDFNSIVKYINNPENYAPGTYKKKGVNNINKSIKYVEKLMQLPEIKK